MKLVIKNDKKTQILTDVEGQNLLEILQNNAYNFSAGCGGNGVCGKCKVKLLQGNYPADEEGYILSCKTILTSDIEIKISEQRGTGLVDFQERKFEIESNEGYGIALDIGTTTLAFSCVDLQTGSVIKNLSSLNPQAIFGADVISRIKAGGEGKLSLLNKLIKDSVNEAIAHFMHEFNIKSIKKLCVTGNTTMLHIFCNEDVSGLGVFPFTPVFLESKILQGKTLGIDAEEITVMPSISAFIGADIVAGALATQLFEDNNVLIDVGTNGEILFSYGGKLFATSTAAGPCFEGAKIECGMGGVDGAISHVNFKGDKFLLETINNAKPIGICGSGLIDAVAFMLANNVIDETGAFAIDGDKFFLTEKVYISQRDIREFQLAKSAIISGLKTLISCCNADCKKINKVFIAGGLGYYLNVDSAISIGLLPSELYDKIEVVGNTALSGAKICLLNERYLKKGLSISKSVEVVELSSNPVFMDEYMNNMFFERK